MSTIIFFDLETTGLDTARCDIIQLAAICGNRVFNAYTVPSQALSKSATEITGFTVHGGDLYLQGVPVETTSLYNLLTSFIAFLKSFHHPVLLVAHNARYFDAPVLTRVLRELALQREFQQVVSGFLDTFLLSKNVYPGLRSYSQTQLVLHFLGKTYTAHHAEEDARMLQELFIAWSPSKRDISRFTYRTNFPF
uniref:DNA polymerase III polC-type-like n=1 Tax=Scatophagus argus TaxID=75038 RepID=UPI001ED80E5F|nr:DNA polymerase III polC-type-like [Scatophagus argus]